MSCHTLNVRCTVLKDRNAFRLERLQQMMASGNDSFLVSSTFFSLFSPSEFPISRNSRNSNSIPDHSEFGLTRRLTCCRVAAREMTSLHARGFALLPALPPRTLLAAQMTFLSVRVAPVLGLQAPNFSSTHFSIRRFSLASQIPNIRRRYILTARACSD